MSSRVTSRLAWSLRAVALTLAFAALLVLSPLTAGNELAIAGLTLAVAVAFRPARRRIQALADRRFSRSKVDAARTLEAFSGRLRQQEIDLNTPAGELCTVVQKTMQPAYVSLWLRAGDRTVRETDPVLTQSDRKAPSPRCRPVERLAVVWPEGVVLEKEIIPLRSP